MSDQVEVVSRDEVKQGLADGSIILIDVREPNEWAAGHIGGAVNMPLSTFDPAALPKDDGKKVVFSCNSGRRTLAALAAAHAAGRTDINAHYEGSFQDWRNSGEPISRD
jgi:rhodanese-related sulfurtransferase